MRNSGDWSDQVQDYCPGSQIPFDLIISELVNYGLSLEDLINLERLSDKAVLEVIKERNLYLEHNNKHDVVLYMNAWATLLELSMYSTLRKDEQELVEEIISF